MATLKISDLSAGDWVHIKSNDKIIEIAQINGQVEEVRAFGKEHFFDFYGLSDIAPIPITAEILEKNGLYRHEIDKDNPQQVVLSNHFMMARTYDDVEWWRVLIYDEEIPNEDLFNGIVYSVHQLQHALRLAGLDKEINL